MAKSCHQCCTINCQSSKNYLCLTENKSIVTIDVVSERKQQWLLMNAGNELMCAGNEMIIPHSCSCCQRVVDLDSSQSSFRFPLLEVDKSKPECAGSKDLSDQCFCPTARFEFNTIKKKQQKNKLKLTDS